MNYQKAKDTIKRSDIGGELSTAVYYLLGRVEDSTSENDLLTRQKNYFEEIAAARLSDLSELTTKYVELTQQVQSLTKERDELKSLLVEAKRILGKVVPDDQNEMIDWAVKSKDSVYTNAGTAYYVIKEALSK